MSRGDKHAYLALSTWMLKKMLEENDKNDEKRLLKYNIPLFTWCWWDQQGRSERVQERSESGHAPFGRQIWTGALPTTRYARQQLHPTPRRSLVRG